MRSAVTELDKEVTSSFSVPPTAERAWINHYHHKSDQDYFEKAARKSVLDKVGIRFENRNLARHVAGEKDSNAVVDESAVIYYLQRCRALQVDPILLTAPSLSSKCTP